MEDYDSVISMVKNGARGVAIPETWWQYRIRKDSMAQSFTRNKELYLYRILSRKHRQFYNSYGTEIANILNHNGPGLQFSNPSKELDSGIKLSKKFILLIKKNRLIRNFAKKLYRIIND